MRKYSRDGSRTKNRVWKIAIIGIVSACVSLVANICVAKMGIGVVTKNASMDVAKWDVSVEGAEHSVDLMAGGGTRNYILTVKNNSDVASDYSIVVSNIPDGVWVGLGDSTMKEPTDGKVSFTETDGSLSPTSEARQHTLKFSAELEADAVLNHNINVGIAFSQKEPRQCRKPNE